MLATTANVFNILQSTASFKNLADMNTFVTNIDGDLLIGLTQLGGLQSSNTADDLRSSTQVHITQNNAITNNLTLSAYTGDAASILKQVGKSLNTLRKVMAKIQQLPPRSNYEPPDLPSEQRRMKIAELPVTVPPKWRPKPRSQKK
jgi:GTP1/Obg family GTP-binding protein